MVTRFSVVVLALSSFVQESLAQPKCNTLQCPGGYQQRPNAVAIPCWAGICNANSVATCCVKTSVAATNQASLVTCSGWEDEWKKCDNLPKCNPCVAVPCGFTQWTQWTSMGGCTGLCTRQRDVQGSAAANSNCGVPCNGVKQESKVGCGNSGATCYVKKDCLWGPWTEWDATGCTYGHLQVGTQSLGQVFSSRLIVQQVQGQGAVCTGTSNRTKPCSAPPGPVNCVFSTWAPWTSCSATCGPGHYQRTRHMKVHAAYGGTACNGPIAMQDACTVTACGGNSACQFGDWSAWQGCDATDPIQHHRTRVIKKRAVGSGAVCAGPMKEMGACATTAGADPQISTWSPWHGCAVTCGGGQQFRSRHVLRGGSHGKHIPTVPMSETGPCATQACPTTGPVCKFSVWAEWSYCSNLCGSGTKNRTRKVLGPFSEDNGCNGPIRQIIPCMGNANNCQNRVDCRWNDWNDWGGCTRSCGSGTQRRERGVAEAPRNGGIACTAQSEEEIGVCNAKSCNAACLDGTWTEWGDWAACQADKCEPGFRSRHRMEASLANDCGTPAQGLTEEFEKCYGQGLDNTGKAISAGSCDVDCQFGDWAAWGACTQTCFGTKRRSRPVAKYAVGKGKPCQGPLKEELNCNPVPGVNPPEQCSSGKVRNCVLNIWSQWTQCTQTCDGGHSRRKRTIQHPASATGTVCQGEALAEIKDCNTQPCPVSQCRDCKWDAWGPWGSCTANEDSRYRRRNIIDMPNHCGKRCTTQAATELSPCNSGGHKTAYCTWQEWGVWSSCPANCGAEKMSRARNLFVTTDLAVNGTWLAQDRRHGTVHFCLGMQTEQQACPFHPCAHTCTKADCIFNDWSEWGEGNSQGLCNRFRSVKANSECGGAPCQGNLKETKQCPVVNNRPQNCELGDWEPWGNCMGKHSQTYRSRPIVLMPHNGGSAAACLKNISQTRWCKPAIPKTNCAFSLWSGWTTCTKSCGTGWQRKDRQIRQPAMAEGTPCNGPMRMMRPCSTTACPASLVDCLWGDWEQWSVCGQDKQRFRDRPITREMQPGGAACTGASSEIDNCPETNCTLSEWTPWSACNKVCDGGQQYRHRQILNLGRNGGDNCPMPLVTWQVDGCNEQNCHPRSDCQMSVWSNWAVCSVTCGHGQTSRSRTITHPRTALGDGCSEPLKELLGCMPKPCPGSKHCHYEQWTAWSACSLKCGGGEMKRSRGFLQTGLHGGAACHAPEPMEEVNPCNTQPCKACKNATWSSWSEWEVCQVTCGRAVTRRHRYVDSSADACGFVGPDKEFKVCGDTGCHGDIDCKFNDWGAWGPCNAACDGLMKTSRAIGVFPQGRGKSCHGPLEVYAPCNPMQGESPPPACHGGQPAVDCQWSEWSIGQCSRACGGGVQMFTRDVKIPSKWGGKACQGEAKHMQSCNTLSCNHKHDCTYGDWQQWGKCDRCGGLRKRFRHITMPTYDGNQCPSDDSEQIQSCSRRCHGNHYCVWDAWSQWGSCSATCGNGRQNRKRNLILSEHQPHTAMPDFQFVQQKFNTLQEDMQRRSQSHMQELVFSFLGGCICFVIVGAAWRLFSATRRSASYSAVTESEDME